MAIQIKSKDEIEKMRHACRITAEAHKIVESMIRPGVTTRELDKAAEAYMRSQGAIPSFLGYKLHPDLPGFDGSICASVNEAVIHGIPSNRVLKEGDIISVDIGAYIGGFHGDAARTHAVGKVSPEAQRLIDVTRGSFFAGIEFARKDCFLHQICGAVQNHVEANGFSVVREYIGHGVGRDLHESPEIPNYKPPGRGPRLAPGMCLAIEPMVNAGTWQIETDRDDFWTVTTKDKKLSAHYENTVLITDGEPEILTLY